jgi:hypothetical protein
MAVRTSARLSGLRQKYLTGSRTRIFDVLLDIILTEFHSLPIAITYFLKFYLNVILPSPSRSYMWPFKLVSP